MASASATDDTYFVTNGDLKTANSVKSFSGKECAFLYRAANALVVLRSHAPALAALLLRAFHTRTLCATSPLPPRSELSFGGGLSSHRKKPFWRYFRQELLILPPLSALATPGNLETFLRARSHRIPSDLFHASYASSLKVRGIVLVFPSKLSSCSPRLPQTFFLRIELVFFGHARWIFGSNATALRNGSNSRCV